MTTPPAGPIQVVDSGRSSVLIDIQSNLSRLVDAMETLASKSVPSPSDQELQRLQLEFSKEILKEMRQLTNLTAPGPPLTADMSNVTFPAVVSRPEPSRD
jgi:hypothetical protein